MQLAFHLSRRPIFTILGLQTVHHVLLQPVLVLGDEEDLAKLLGSVAGVPTECSLARRPPAVAGMAARPGDNL